MFVPDIPGDELPDPTQRIWMARDSYKPAVPLGNVMQSFAVGQVIESCHPDFKPGDLVRGVEHPTANAFVGEIEATLGKQLFDIAIA